MGVLDDVLNRAAPGGLSKPLMIALGALLVGKMLGATGGAASAPSGQPSDPTLVPQQGQDGGLLGGLGGLLDKLKEAGHEDKVNSWVGPGQNKPINPNQLGSALGPKTVNQLSQQTGMNEQDLLSQLAQSLPNIIDKLTPGGRIPTMQELADAFTRGLQQQANRN